MRHPGIDQGKSRRTRKSPLYLAIDTLGSLAEDIPDDARPGHCPPGVVEEYDEDVAAIALQALHHTFDVAAHVLRTEVAAQNVVAAY
jgi:hypothetical protein